MDPLIDLALLLFGAKLGGIIFSKLRQPSVAGELIAGLILGPSLLALVNPTGLVKAVSDLGLLFLILLISLTVDWKILEGNTEKYVWMELTRLLLTLLMVFGVVYIIGWNIYVFVILGVTLTICSTAIASRTLADMKKLNTKEGNILMGLEVVDEVVAIVSVALLANMMSGGAITIEPIVTTIFVVVGFFVVMSRLGKFLNKVTGSLQKYGIEEALFGFTLLVAFLLGSLTEGLNMASILGVFMAGMILSRSAQHPIITRKVKEIGESFFIPVFFASVGLTVNIMLAFQQVYLIVGLIVMILVVKMVAATASMKMFRYSTDESLKIGSGFLALSEMIVVIAALSVTRISPALYASIIASFVIVNTICPIVMNYAFSKDMGKFSLGLKPAKHGFGSKPFGLPSLTSNSNGKTGYNFKKGLLR
jgi:Kef-type K+ transport system membrane component KefB